MIDISSDWLRAQTTVEEIEAERWKTKPNKGEPVRPQTARWIAFKTQIRAGDEVWRYSSPPDSWVGMIGTAGIAIVRDGGIVATFETFHN